MAMRNAHSAVRILLSALSLLGTAPAWADGTLTHLSGPVSVKKPDGKTLPGAAGVKVSVGDIVATGAGGFVRIEMTDGGEMVLRPDSQLQIESYQYVPDKPTQDNFVYRMFKGGLRTVTGLVGKRGNRDAYKLITETATIGIRGTQFDLRVCAANCGALADGTYLAVRFGAVQTTNAQGTLPVAAGQVAYVPPQRPPVILPRDPGIGFTPPPVIPKLDEKKKVQAAAAAANTPDQPKPAAGGAAQQGQTAQGGAKPASGASSSGDGSGKTDNEGKTEGSGKPDGGSAGSPGRGRDGGGANADGKASGQESSGSSATSQQAAQGSQAVSSTSSASPPSGLSPSQSGAGPECSVQ